MEEKDIILLKSYEIDVEGALYRLFGNKELYMNLLVSFMNDNTVVELGESIKKNDWDAAFTIAHALKGVAGNLGFIPLLHKTGQLVVSIRKGNIGEIDELFKSIMIINKEMVELIAKCNLKEGDEVFE